MIFKLHKKINVIIGSVVLIHLIALFYFLVFRQFFQQDEWHSFGVILALGTKYITLNKSPVELLLGDRVGARVITYIVFQLFKINPMTYGLLAFVYQAVNTFLVFVLAKKLTQNKTISLLSSLFFLINELGNEGYSWFGTMNGSAPAVMLFLISFIFYLNFLANRKIRYFTLSLVTLWLSFLFKEIALFAFAFYPVVYFLYYKGKDKKDFFIKTHIFFFAFALIILGFYAKSVLFISGDQANYVGGSNGSFVSSFILHSVQYPLEGAVQTFVPNAFMFTVTGFFTRIFTHYTPDTPDFDFVVQNQHAEIMTITIGLLTIMLLVWLLRSKRIRLDKKLSFAFFISIIMLILSFIPYVVINRSFSYLDSRHYYMATIPASISLSILLISMRTKTLKIVALLFGIGFIILHETVLWQDFSLLMQRSDERQSFLKQVNSVAPKLSQKTVFYITGDSGGYYALPELKVPFQSGPGHVLMVNYVVKRQLSSGFFKESTFQKELDVGFLYDILGQGYREVNGRGFGYYYDESELNKAINKGLFEKKDIISLFYNSDSQTLTKKKY
ncbi:MAG TPA: hypothetical protein VLF68_04300 [Candidatus Saccharimonadales bacterium]|nr:hypothetical protein [Candidatus Saccharimonadales bacterium]